jgi:cobyrinic acid a,c-diamide synthase
VTGYRQFEPETNIAGVILNNVSGSRHESKLRTSIERYCGLPVVGIVPKDNNLKVKERHLGLVPYKESLDSKEIIDRLNRVLTGCFDIEGILAIARSAGNFGKTEDETSTGKAAMVRIGVMHDRVFTFYYPENLEALTRAGAELVFIDSMQDRDLPDIDGLYIGGGFPELFLEELEENSTLRQDIAQAAESGLPIYAECAGLMYLCSGIKWNGQRYEMVGIISTEIELYRKPQGHGYVEIEVTGKNPWFPVGINIRGHEFHHSKLSRPFDNEFAYSVKRGHGINGKQDAIVYKNVLAAFTHLHALGVPGWAENFVSLALQEKKNHPVFSS